MVTVTEEIKNNLTGGGFDPKLVSSACDPRLKLKKKVRAKKV
jgi:hypothetical protein